VASDQRGITLIELLVAMAIVGLMLAITFPSFTAGLDGIVLRSDIDRAGSFFNEARLQADRLQQPVQLTADPGEHEISAVSVDGSWEESFVLSDRSHIVFPKQKQSLILHPSTPAPQFRLLLESERGSRTGLQTNIFTGVPEDWNPGGGDVQ
jgi:prepilin-type N-terminal cleavage/methylation domain-containing protein